MLKLTKKADYGLMALKYLAEHPELVDQLRAKLVEQRKAENARLGAAPASASAEPTSTDTAAA